MQVSQFGASGPRVAIDLRRAGVVLVCLLGIEPEDARWAGR